ncbi:MAG: IS200/IS605 family transposase [Desulfamplus sp.]|nr:IS200/IS605 family transposase [Desulfamplus sp.]
MAFWKLYYHIVWGTKNRLPLITEQMEEQLYKYITMKSEELKSITHALGGIDDHIHLVVSIPPALSISEYVGKIKGSSSHFVNHRFDNSQFFVWQEKYGVFSLGSKQLDDAVDYVVKQKEHHYTGSIIPVLEKYDDKD